MFETKTFLWKFDLYQAQHIIGALTWLICITEIIFFSLYFSNRDKIEYFAVGLQGYIAVTPAVTYVIQYCDEHPAIKSCWAWVWGIMMICGQFIGFTCIVLGMTLGGD